MTGAASDELLRERHLPLPGTYNVRDVGGYPTSGGGVVRRGVLFRGDSLHDLDDRGRSMLEEAGVRTVIDLRDATERRAYPSALPPSGVRLVEMPIIGDGGPEVPFADGWALADLYPWFAEQCASRFAVVARELARQDQLPALVHCMAGKDRTGMVVAIVLSAVGVSEELVAADFGASSTFLANEGYRQVATARALGHGLPPDHIDWAFVADPQHIRRALRAIDDRYGDCAGYLLAHDLTEDELHALREALVELPDA